MEDGAGPGRTVSFDNRRAESICNSIRGKPGGAGREWVLSVRNKTRESDPRTDTSRNGFSTLGAIKINRRSAEGFKRTTAVSKKESPTSQDTKHRQRTDGEEKMTFLPETRESRRVELEL